MRGEERETKLVERALKVICEREAAAYLEDATRMAGRRELPPLMARRWRH